MKIRNISFDVDVIEERISEGIKWIAGKCLEPFIWIFAICFKPFKWMAGKLEMQIESKLSLLFLFAVSLICLAVNMPKLPEERYTFKEVSTGNHFSNYQYSTLIFDKWTGAVKYVAEGSFPGKDSEEAMHQSPVGSTINYGSEPNQILIERYIVYGVQGFLLLLSFIVAMIPTKRKIQRNEV